MRPNRTTILIAAIAGLIVLLIVALASVVIQSARYEPSPRNDPAVAPATPASSNQITAAPAAPTGDPDDALSRWLAGGWAEEATNCQTDTGDYYDPSGRYGRSGAEGLWRIENGALVVTVTHEAVGDPMAHEYIGLPNPEITRSRITREGPDRMMQAVDGRPVRMMRCPSAHHSFAT